MASSACVEPEFTECFSSPVDFNGNMFSKAKPRLCLKSLSCLEMR